MPEVTPAARERADELGIDPESIEGTGSEGRVTKEDVDRAVGGSGEAVRVRPHPAAGSVVVGPDGTAYRAGDTVARSVFDEFQQKELYGRATHDYPEGYPLLVEMKESE